MLVNGSFSCKFLLYDKIQHHTEIQPLVKRVNLQHLCVEMEIIFFSLAFLRLYNLFVLENSLHLPLSMSQQLVLTSLSSLVAIVGFEMLSSGDSSVIRDVFFFLGLSEM